ncbi:MAG: 4-hydroxythreonine-4-phosphate dehydrogenase PdxA [Marinosulfonomonas sp.]|nr:4-hydroxythreonine-4-phosphate dehydrogenase PdxA [Marinosulfonomonas sp.]
MSLPKIGLMIGDPGGVGPEVCVQAMASGRAQSRGDLVLIGNACAVERAVADTGVKLPVVAVSSMEEALNVEGLPVIECGALKRSEFEVGQSSAASGRAVKAWMDEAARLSQSGALDGWIMAPINSDSMRLASVADNLDALQPPGTFMFRLSGPLRAVPIAEHVPMRAIAATVTRERIEHVIGLTDANLRRWGIASPRIGVAGLNPHAMFEEDRDIIAPAVKAARAGGIIVEGPVTPDAVFRQCIQGKYDAVVTMYHDQGQIALKTAAFAGACTVYLGLDYVQLSVPHGTAYDIAGTGTAQYGSMVAAACTALDLAAGRGFLAMKDDEVAP